MLSILRIQQRSTLKRKREINSLSSWILANFIPSSHFKHTVVSNTKFNYGSHQSYLKEGPITSRYFPTSPIELAENTVKESLLKTSPRTTEDWDKIKNELINEIEIVSEFNFGNIMMNCFIQLNKLDEAHSFMEYLNKGKIEPNHLTYLKYMDICGRNFERCDQKIILQAYEKVKPFIESAPVLDKVRSEHIIQGLCGTDKWFLALDYIKKIPENPSITIKNSIAAAAIRHSDENLAWEIITKWCKMDGIPCHRVFKAFLLHSLKLQLEDSKRSEIFLMDFFNYLQQKGSILNEECVQLVEKYFRGHSPNWHISYSKVNRNGECSSCNNSLEIMDLSANDFMYLRKAFLERSLKKSDIFINTTTHEFNQYIRFVENRKPFDIVLDGLNVAHFLPQTRNPKILAQQLLKVVELFWNPSLRILVLGRNHMLHWPQHIMNKISTKAHLFLTSNISQDDPFMVYAALESGPSSCIVSLDLMRDHLSRLNDPKLITLFKRWQQTHQIFITADENKELKFIKPLKHSINIQGNMKDGWHIPFDDKVILDPYEELNNWLCIQRTNKIMK